jgi:hypothetical protein
MFYKFLQSGTFYKCPYIKIVPFRLLSPRVIYQSVTEFFVSDIEQCCSEKCAVIIEHGAAKFNIPTSLFSIYIHTYTQHAEILRFLLYVINIETRLAWLCLAWVRIADKRLPSQALV